MHGTDRVIAFSQLAVKGLTCISSLHETDDKINNKTNVIDILTDTIEEAMSIGFTYRPYIGRSSKHGYCSTYKTIPLQLIRRCSLKLSNAAMFSKTHLLMRFSIA
jgi:hypothetical protein